MLEKILTDRFRKLVRAVLTDVRNQQDLRDEKEFAKDEERIKNELLDDIVPCPANEVLDEDFTVAAVDGSGTENFGILDDVRLHLVSTSVVVLQSNTRRGTLFEPMDRAQLESELNQEQPHLDMHWHSGVRNDARDKLAASLSDIYPNKSVTDLIVHFFQDYLGPHVSSFSDIDSTDYAKHKSKLESIQGLISRAGFLTNTAVHDELRRVSEYAAARTVLISEIRPKYILLDGALSVFMHFVLKYPSMPSGFMLRELCSLSRERNVILCAVSKNHTIPFAHRIAKMAEEKFGTGSKWFCLLPSQKDPGGGLHIYSDRTYIPPRLAVPYLFSFSEDNRPSRIDFDRVWWKKNIFVRDDPAKTREKEKALFQEIEFMSRDARWYGYPVALALAHEECKLSYEDLRMAREVFADVLHELGADVRRSTPMREDYGL
ncbi:MAG: hypothetical protein JSW61_14495 [Candidatus Thorarchaeota archaeon]|nr:MAG: hypothetical protein JSW61_14495 [Candidatus Thorarchaeota archaeon]